MQSLLFVSLYLDAGLSIKYLHTSSKYGRLVPLTDIVRLVLSQQITLTKGLRLPPGS